MKPSGTQTALTSIFPSVLLPFCLTFLTAQTKKGKFIFKSSEELLIISEISLSASSGLKQAITRISRISFPFIQAFLL